MTPLRINFPSSGCRHYMSRSNKKATNLVLTVGQKVVSLFSIKKNNQVITVFMVTNIPYMVDEFMRQEILTKSWYISLFMIF